MKKPRWLTLSMNKPVTKLLLSLIVVVTPLLTASADEQSSAPAVDTYNKAVRLYEAKHWAQAKEYFHQYLAEYSDTPLYVTCLYYLAFCYQQLKDTKQANFLYHKVIDAAKEGDKFWGEMAEHRLEELGE